MDLSREKGRRLQFMSDLHLERVKYDYTFDTAQKASILLLAGDIGRFCDLDAYKTFLANQCARYDMVLLLAGNHEFYGSSRQEGLGIADSFVKDPGMDNKLHFMNRSRLDLPGLDLTILGCTLHSFISPGYTKLTNDFQRIKDWTVSAHNAEHEKDRNWLKESLQNIAAESDTPRRIIIATHYAPSFEKTTHPAKENNAISQCFSSHLLQEVSNWRGSELISHWIFGHTHWNSKFRSGKITVQSNQLCNDCSELSWLQKKTIYRPFNSTATLKIS